MATFELTDTDGQVYEVDAPDEQSAVAALKKMKAQGGARDFGNPTLNAISNALHTVTGPLEAFGMSATDMMALGGADEIVAAPKAVYDWATTDKPFSEAYAEALAALENRRGAIKSQYPGTSLAGSITGAVTGPAAKAGADFVAKGVTMGERALRSIVPGFLGGTTAGALTAEGGLPERAEGAVWGGMAGAGLAPAAQVGGELVGRGLSKLFDVIRGRGQGALPPVASGQIDDPVTAAVRAQGASPKVSGSEMEQAARELWRRLELDGVDPAKVFQAIQSGQMDERTLAGIGGPNVRQMIDTYASMPGPAKEIVAGAQRAAEQGQTQNLMRSTGQTLGVKTDFTSLDDAITQQKTTAAPLYDKFYAISPDRLDTDFMRNLLKNPLSKDLLASARLLNQIDQARGEIPDDVIQYLLDAEGNVSTNTTVSPRAADYIKRALDAKVQDYIDPLTGQIKGGIGHAWDQLRRAFIANLDEVAPEYAAARQAFSGPAAMKDAMEMGRKILREDWIGNRKAIEAMTKSEKEALKVGAFQAVEDMLTGISNKADKAARFANVEKYLDRLWPAFDSKKTFEAFKKAIQAQTAEFGAVQMAGRGSQTAPRAADMIDSLGEVRDAGQAVGGDVSAILRAIKGLSQRMTAPSEGQRAAAAALALTKAPNALPLMSAVRSRPGGDALGLMLMNASRVPASQASGLLARP